MDLPFKCNTESLSSNRRPYSTTTSIKSIIHGPSIENLEQELRKLEVAQESARILSARSSKHSNNDKTNLVDVGRLSVASRGSIYSNTNNSGTYKSTQIKKQRPKTCIASFPSRESVNSRDSALDYHDVHNIKYKRNKCSRPATAFHQPLVEVGENETLQQRHRWAIRSNTTSNLQMDNTEKPDVSNV